MKRDAAALAFVLIVPSVMTWAEFTVLPRADPDSKPALQWLFAAGKLLQFAFPVLYVWAVDRTWFGLTTPRRQDVLLGAGIGLVVGGGALGLHFLWLCDTPLMAQTGALLVRWLDEYGLASPAGYWSMTLVMVTLHALLEEYYWRWFVFGRLRRYAPMPVALGVSSLGFMAHHVVILSIYLPGFFWLGVMPLSLCVAVGGIIWGWLYERSRSLVPCWISHALVDLALMTVGWDLVVRYWSV